MPVAPPINFKNWIEENRHLLKPPVGNSVVYEEGDFMIMVVGGPNSRKDYHVDPVEEFFYQLEGDMLLKIMDEGKPVDVPIKEGEIFLLPKNIPHSPQRFENTVGLVVEYQREEVMNAMICSTKLPWTWKISLPNYPHCLKLIGTIQMLERVGHVALYNNHLSKNKYINKDKL